MARSVALSEVRLCDTRGRAFSLSDVNGRPTVVACCSLSPHHPSEPAQTAEWGARADGLEAVRSELRGLGAALIVVEPEALWLLQPDDPPEPLRLDEISFAVDPSAHDESPGAAERPTLDSLRATLGGDAAVRSGALTVVMVGDNGEVQWRWSDSRQRGDDRQVLLRALRRAAELRAGPPTDGVMLLTRRSMMASTLAAALFAALMETPPVSAATPVPADEVPVTLNVNGSLHTLRIEPRVSLLDALREQLKLTGTKKGCDHGQCGACTVLVDGRRIDSCLTLAIMYTGTAITTIEGLAPKGSLHPMQAAFLEHDGFQCGYCTPGQIMSAVGLIAEGHAHSERDVREQMSGNLCRCGAYPNIVAAIEHVRKG